MVTMSAKDFLSYDDEDEAEIVQAPESSKGKPVFLIYDDLPLPETKRRTGGESKYPFAKLEVGHSFIVPPEHVPEKGGISAIRAAIYNYRKANKVKEKFTSRLLSDGSIAVWRVA